MKLPLCEEVVIVRRKLDEYLLSVQHPVGGAKARFFLSRGFAVEDPERLEGAIRDLACGGEVVETVVTRWGTKYVVEGEVEAPDGSELRLRSVWLQKGREIPPVFVTAYPSQRE